MATTMKLYQAIARTMQAHTNCRVNGNKEWERNHEQTARDYCTKYMPSGSGIDTGTHIDLDASSGNKLVFDISYHHMNDVGMYDGWSEHTVIVTSDLCFGFDTRITGRNRNGIKDYLAEVYHLALNQDVEI